MFDSLLDLQVLLPAQLKGGRWSTLLLTDTNHTVFHFISFILILALPTSPTSVNDDVHDLRSSKP